MQDVKRAAGVAIAILVLTLTATAENKVFRYTVSQGASISVVNDSGAVTVRQGSANQVIVTANSASSKIEADSRQNGNRIDVRTRFAQPASGSEARMDYDVQAPPDAVVIVRAGNGPVKVQNVSGDISVDADTAQVDVRDISNAHVHVRTVNGPIVLTNIRNGHVEVTSVGGQVTLNDVIGTQVSANTTAGAIRYTGDFAGGGEYSLSSHSGDIDVSLPISASVDLSARSVTGSVENNNFPLQPDQRPPVPQAQGKSFAGRANSGASSVVLRTFSGKIRVTKQ